MGRGLRAETQTTSLERFCILSLSNIHTKQNKVNPAEIARSRWALLQAAEPSSGALRPAEDTTQSTGHAVPPRER